MPVHEIHARIGYETKLQRHYNGWIIRNGKVEWIMIFVHLFEVVLFFSNTVIYYPI